MALVFAILYVCNVEMVLLFLCGGQCLIIPACPSLICFFFFFFFNKGNVEGTNFENLCLMFI